MNKILIFLAFFFFIIIAIFTMPWLIFNVFDITKSTGYISLDSFVFLLTLAVAIISLLFVLIGVFEFNRVNNYTKKVDNFKEYFDKHINNHKNEVNSIIYSLNQQDLYIDKTINYLFQASFSIINQMEDKKLANKILENLFHDLQISKLYRSSLNSDITTKIENNKFGALSYLKENGSTKDIPHLQYVAEHDSNKENRIRAHEIIGRIKERETRDQRSSYLSLNVIHI